MTWFTIVFLTTFYKPTIGLVSTISTSNSQISRTLGECEKVKAKIEKTSSENVTVVCAKVFIAKQ